MRANSIMVCAILTAFALSSVPAESQTRRHTASSVITLPANTYFRLRMNEDLSSENARVGDTFTAEVVTPVYHGRKEVVPAGSTVTGRVTSVVRAKDKGQPGSLGVSFTGIKLPGRSRRLIDGSLTEVVDKDSGKIDDEGRLKGGSAKKRNIVFIGGGAAGGAILGSIIGGRKGGAIGLAAGGAAGVIASVLKKGNEAKVNRGTEVGMVLNRPAVLPR
ncbi:MAG TPA: hypothetical protein VFC63_12870 [Blastocatellia bacterium]|nr:hypothetical protein [Blastocatellia bacterium]